MPRLTVGDRLSAAAVGLFFGGVIGFGLAWLTGVYSNTLGPSSTQVDVKHWVGFCAIGFGAVGLIFGPFVGTLLGSVISGIFRFERAEEEAPTWLLVLILLAVVAVVWWSAS
ncbi:MAG: hypothetical protein KF891_02900 [Rhizobacter sp.]|nr:hypothetical protein [Rhizobacter sp.]